MRTDELRNVLHQHGDDVRDSGAHARVTAVHQRVRTVRRRRASLAGGGVVAAVAAIAVMVVPNLTQPDPGPADAPHRLAGHDVPDTETAIGYTFDYVRGIEKPAARGPLEITLPASDEPRLVKWASSVQDADRPLLIDVSTADHDLSRPGVFEGYEYLDPGMRHRVAVEQTSPVDGEQIALAVYELSDELPEGVAGQGIRFRAEQLDDRLVDAVIGEPGVSEVSTTVVVPEGALRVTELCFGPDGGSFDHMAWLVVDGRPLWGASCSERELFDVGTDGTVLTDELRRRGIEPGDSIDLTPSGSWTRAPTVTGRSRPAPTWCSPSPSMRRAGTPSGRPGGTSPGATSTTGTSGPCCRSRSRPPGRRCTPPPPARTTVLSCWSPRSAPSHPAAASCTR